MNRRLIPQQVSPSSSLSSTSSAAAGLAQQSNVKADAGSSTTPKAPSVTPKTEISSNPVNITLSSQSQTQSNVSKEATIITNVFFCKYCNILYKNQGDCIDHQNTCKTKL